MNMDVIDCNVLYFKDNWVCLTRRPGRVCLRRTPTALGSDVVCSTDLEEVVVDQAEKIVVVISSRSTA